MLPELFQNGLAWNGVFMILRDALFKGIETLRNAKIETPDTDAGVMLCSVLKRDRVFLYTHGDEILDDSVLNRFFECIALRAAGMPVQYITGVQEFMSLEFTVNSHVLIPRHDTEILVETVIAFADSCRDTGRELHILDIGTGSGCIAVSLAHYIENCRVTATDTSEEALKTARINSEKNGVKEKIAFKKSDLFENLKGECFDIIVSNPPYIPAGDIKDLQKEVRDYEPLTALDGGTDGLDFYRAIIGGVPEHLKPGGLIAFEVGINQANAVAELLDKCCHEVKVVKDLGGIDRVVYGRLKKTDMATPQK